MASKEIVRQIPHFIRIYSDGTVERLLTFPFAPPSPNGDPQYNVLSKDVSISATKFSIPNNDTNLVHEKRPDPFDANPSQQAQARKQQKQLHRIPHEPSTPPSRRRRLSLRLVVPRTISHSQVEIIPFVPLALLSDAHPQLRNHLIFLIVSHRIPKRKPGKIETLRLSIAEITPLNRGFLREIGESPGKFERG